MAGEPHLRPQPRLEDGKDGKDGTDGTITDEEDALFGIESRFFLD